METLLSWKLYFDALCTSVAKYVVEFSYSKKKMLSDFPDILFFSMQMNREKLMKMAGAVRTGGKGSMRRC